MLGLPLWKISLVFLMVGHTHDALDRFFSRLVMALRGRNWKTPDDMLDLMREHVHYTNSCSGHVRQVWAWKLLADKQVNPCYREIQGYRKSARGVGLLALFGACESQKSATDIGILARFWAQLRQKLQG